MAKSNGLKRFVIVLLGFAATVALWLVVDAPVEPGRSLQGVVTQSVYVPARYSGGYTRIVVEVKGGTVVTFQRYGQSYLKPGMRVTVLLRQRRLSKFDSYELLQ